MNDRLLPDSPNTYRPVSDSSGYLCRTALTRRRACPLARGPQQMSETTDAYSLKKRSALGQTAFSLGTVIHGLRLWWEGGGESLHHAKSCRPPTSVPHAIRRWNG